MIVVKYSPFTGQVDWSEINTSGQVSSRLAYLTGEVVDGLPEVEVGPMICNEGNGAIFDWSEDQSDRGPEMWSYDVVLGPLSEAAYDQTSFAEQAKAFIASGDDIETMHRDLDGLMERTLEKLGFSEGVEAIKASIRWYA